MEAVPRHVDERGDAAIVAYIGGRLLYRIFQEAPDFKSGHGCLFSPAIHRGVQ